MVLSVSFGGLSPLRAEFRGAGGLNRRVSRPQTPLTCSCPGKKWLESSQSRLAIPIGSGRGRWSESLNPRRVFARFREVIDRKAPGGLVGRRYEPSGVLRLLRPNLKKVRLRALSTVP